MKNYNIFIDKSKLNIINNFKLWSNERLIEYYNFNIKIIIL